VRSQHLVQPKFHQRFFQNLLLPRFLEPDLKVVEQYQEIMIHRF